MSRLKVTLKRGFSGATHKQINNVRGLGLKRRHQSVVVDDTAATRGMIEKVSHMVDVEELED